MYCSSEGFSLPVQRCPCTLGSAHSGCHEAAAPGTAFSLRALAVVEAERMAAGFRFPRPHR